ncbi:PUA domain-containing protein, partial [Clavibacter michiganensis]|uniref:PUA domain-containing protein n=1 Tax=Clavibacter michiganensis TaxID=28447 RepID=UPI0029308191
MSTTAPPPPSTPPHRPARSCGPGRPPAPRLNPACAPAGRRWAGRRIAAAAGIPVVLTSAIHAAEALSGGDTGTYFHATGKRSADRLLWLQHASTPQGSLTLDDGAVRAVVERRKSLLPAGIAAVEGEFSAGDPVELRQLDRVARAE